MSDDSDDLSLFRQAMEDVRRLEHDRVEHDLPRPPPHPHQREADDRRVMEELLDTEPDEGMESGEELSYLSPGMQRKVLRKLRRGLYRIDDELDLHGMTVPVAQAMLQEFLAEAVNRRMQGVRVIHGKGLRSSNRGPVLKPKVDRWLRQHSQVLAFCSAPPADGGTGAVYVLLKR